jgi:hypothetical protein
MVNTTPEIMKRETPKGGSQVSVRGYVRQSQKRGQASVKIPKGHRSRIPWDVEPISDILTFQSSGNHKGRGTTVGCSLKVLKAETSG